MKTFLRRILVTGANGFIGKNLIVRLSEIPNLTIIPYGRTDDPSRLPSLISSVDAIVHLAGENRPTDPSAFTQVNDRLTSLISNIIQDQYKVNGRTVPLIFASSVQALQDSPYGRSKLNAESHLQALADSIGNPCAIFRLPGTFGKWSRPNYNSVVATFCYNIARGLPIHLSEPKKVLQLVYIDDVVEAFLKSLSESTPGSKLVYVNPEYSITLEQLENQIRSFSKCRSSLVSERVGIGLVRALYATYTSFLPKDAFVYNLSKHTDQRGSFVEMIKTLDSGQVSYFTAHPGVTRGGHYHHTKSEKFLIAKGKALFRFRHLITNELVELVTDSETPRVVDTIPGWSHDITNIGTEEMLVILWANETYDRNRPDTVSCKI